MGNSITDSVDSPDYSDVELIRMAPWKRKLDSVDLQDVRDETWSRALHKLPHPQKLITYQKDEKELTVAVKADKDKLRFDLIPTEVMEEIADIYTFGSRKYSDWNWAKGFNWGRVYAAMQRHLHAWHRGEDLDPESGRSHMAHAAWNALSLIYHIKYFPHLDDRYKRPCVK